MNYRREIDGLRTVAVMAVIFSHAGFPWFHGGFIGVDIFFVISGYLITGIILKERAAQTFSFASFYERRVRRILPALFVVLFACLPFAWWYLNAAELKDFAKSLVAVNVFASNILFSQSTGYFETTAALKPLLHTWSLAVEEQFYLFFPVLFIVAYKLGKPKLHLLLAVVALCSLVVAQWAVTHQPAFAFYWLPTRVWEFFIGTAIALYLQTREHHQHPQWMQHSLSTLGLALLLFAIVTFNAATPFPGISALIPTIGAALIILFTTPATFVGKLLGSRVFVSIGLISYSAYLWHQPVFAFARTINLEEPSVFTFALLIAFTLCLSYLSWRFVETPLRNKAKWTKKTVYVASIIFSVLLVALGSITYINNGFEHRFKIPPTIAQSFQTSARSAACFDKDLVQTRDDWYCDLGNTKKEMSFFELGDSHALSLLDTFDQAATDENVHGGFAAIGSCTPLLGVYTLEGNQQLHDCQALNQRVFAYVKAQHIPHLYLVARWSFYTDRGYTGRDHLIPLGLTPDSTPSQEGSRVAFDAGLKATMAAYTAIGVDVTLIEQVPQQRFNPQSLDYERYKDDPDALNAYLKKSSVTLQEHEKLQSYSMHAFAQYTKRPHTTLLSLDDVYCQEGVCVIGTDKRSYYLDNNHLTNAGGALALDKIHQSLKQDK